MKKTWLVSKKTILIIILIFPFFISNQIMSLISIDAIYDLWRIIDFIYILCLTLQNRWVPSKIAISISLLWSTLILSSIINNSRTSGSVMKVLTILLFVLIVDYYLNKAFENTLSAILFCFEFFIYINFIAILLFPDSFASGTHEKIWLLGSYAAQVKWFLPALCVAKCYSITAKQRKRKSANIRYRAILIVITLSSALSGSATLASTIILMGFLWFLHVRKKFDIKSFYGIICQFLFFAFIVCFRLQNYFSFIIVSLLHRDLTFTGRTYIWDYALLLFAKHPIVGNGYWTYIPMPNWRGLYGTVIDGVSVASHAHCQILQFLIQGGLVFTVGFVVFNYKFSNYLKKDKSTIFQWISLCIFMLLFAGVAENIFDSPLSLIPYLVGYHLYSFLT